MINAHLLDTPAPPAVQRGVATMGLHVRYPDDTIVPVSVPPGVTPRAQWAAIDALGERYTLHKISLVSSDRTRVRVSTYVKRTGELAAESGVIALGDARRDELNTRSTVDVVLPA